MKFKVFDVKAPVVPPEPEVTLRLVRSATGMLLCAVDEKGETLKQGNLLMIRPSGVEALLFVNPDLGFELDSKRRLKLT